MLSNMNQSTLNNTPISNNLQGNSPINVNRIGQINKFQENRDNLNVKYNSNNNYNDEMNKSNIGNSNYVNNGVMTNSNINNIINRKRAHHQVTGIENITNLNTQNVKIIEPNQQNFQTPLNPRSDQYDYKVKKFKY